VKRTLAWFACLLFLLCTPLFALAEIAEDEQEYFYDQMDALVYGIGNRYMTLEGQQAAVDYLTGEFEALGCSIADGTLRLSAVKGLDSNDDTFVSSNVIGTLKAHSADPDVLILCAHFDSKGPGARDNASGVAAVLTMCRRFAALEPFENAELRFICFTAEEPVTRARPLTCRGFPRTNARASSPCSTSISSWWTSGRITTVCPATRWAAARQTDI
jgi:hypothetical protein